MQYTTLPLRGLLLASACASLVACATIPSVRTPAPPREAKTLASQNALGGGTADFPEDRWWTGYADPTLDALISEALAGSPDMALAAARIRSSDAIAEQAGAVLTPSLTVEGAAGGNKQSYNMGIPAQFVPKGIVSTGKLSANLGFNLDLWGRNRAALAAARGDAQAARVDAAQARLLLTTSIASAWADFSQIWAARDVAAEAAHIRGETERLTEARMREGIDNAADLELARSRHAAARGELAASEEALALSRNRIAALLGAGPDRGESLPRPTLSLTSETLVPANLSANLVGRRPDIVSARLRAEAAASRVKAAKRDFYPNINLSAVAGLQSLGLSNLFNSGSSTANFGPAISLPIFDGGRLAGNYRGASAAYEEAVARYDQTLIASLREVADALQSKRALQDRLSAAHGADRAAREAARLAALRYRQGVGNLLQLLAAEDTALSTHRAVTDLEARAFLLDISLIRALGGGFSPQTLSKENSDR
jgi:NodT family efflux transporter outer membrane factor (OMF) lipoprotein